MTTTPRDLTQWIENAQYALDHVKGVTVDQLRALAATPDQARHDGTGRSTWWSEELARVATRKARDRFPNNGTDADVNAWKERQDRYTDMMEDLADAHAECLVSAGAAHSLPARTKKRRRTAADDALSHALPDAA